MTWTRTHTTAVILFAGLALFYMAFSPGSIAGRGYTSEEIESGLRMLTAATAWIKGHPVPPMTWSRHGPLPVLFDLPFLKVGKRLISPDFILSFEPSLFTAALLVILYLWLRKVCSAAVALFLTFTAAFGTMLWPYAYIGLETKQSLFVFLAGYLALANGRIRNWGRVVLFGLSCGLALALKSNGIVLWPVVAYLIYIQFWERRQSQRVQLITIVALVVLIYLLGSWGRSFYWGPLGGAAKSFRFWLIDSPLQFFTNAVGVFGSPTKGLFVYAPMILLCVFALPKVFRTDRPIAFFALLVTGCTVLFISIFRTTADETWGERYLHVSVAPLMLCIGYAWPRFAWRRHLPAIILAGIGICISFLGAFYYYGVLDFAAKEAGQNTMEWITGDENWNPVLFNARLFRVWVADSGTAPVLWTPAHIWVWTPPPSALPWKSINLRDYCQPQSFMLRFWHLPKSGLTLQIFRFFVLWLVVGLLLLSWTIVSAVQEEDTRGDPVLRPENREVRVAAS
jgi:hypothetical protein